MSEFKITPAIARAEIARRANNKRPGVDYEPAADASLMELGSKALATIAAKRTRKPAVAQVAQVAKVARTVDPHTALRAEAWTYRQDERKAGRKVSYARACALFGTTPARSAK